MAPVVIGVVVVVVVLDNCNDEALGGDKIPLEVVAKCRGYK